MEQVKKNEYYKGTYSISFTVGVFIVSTFLLPDFTIVSSLPKVQISDLLILPAIVLLWINRSKIDLLSNMKFYVLWLFFAFFMVASLLANERFFVLQDLFELFKLFKFLFFVVFLSSLYSAVDIDKLIRITFVCVLIFNIIHYFDLMNFNSSIMPYYSAECQWKTFGLNSIGQPDIKRMLGTLGNPNNNAIMFLFFVIYFFPKKESSKILDFFYYTALLAFFACQSRTGFIAFGACLIFLVWVSRASWKIYVKHVVVYALLFFALIVGEYNWSKSKTNYITTLSGKAWKSNSVKGRFEVWQMLWDEIKVKPLLGHAPNKEFFYANQIYAESQYVLYAYRYGFIGLAVFLVIALFIIKDSYPLFRSGKHNLLFLFTLVLLITSITNVPFSDSKLSMVFALSIAIFFNYKNTPHEA